MEIGAYLQNPLENCTLSSDVPELCTREECYLGIDEAGRGPVMGPMVYGCCYCPISRNLDLKALKVADSKILSKEQRDEMLASIQASKEFIGWRVVVLSPNYLSNAMLQRSKYNLNAISHDTAIDLIQGSLDAGVRVREVFVDTVGDASKYQTKLAERFPQLAVTVKPKADSLFAVVSAASICAKVVRDQTITNWHYMEEGVTFGPNLGSGYPSDPQTKQWLREHVDPVFGFPTLVRFSWSTCQEILDREAMEVHWEDDEEDGSDQLKKASKGTRKLEKFFASKDSTQTSQRHRFFRERGLTLATKL